MIVLSANVDDDIQFALEESVKVWHGSIGSAISAQHTLKYSLFSVDEV